MANREAILANRKPILKSSNSTSVKEFKGVDQRMYYSIKKKQQLTLLLNAAHSFRVESCKYYTRLLLLMIW